MILFTLLIVQPEPTYQVASSGPGSAGPIAHYDRQLCPVCRPGPGPGSAGPLAGPSSGRIGSGAESSTGTRRWACAAAAGIVCSAGPASAQGRRRAGLLPSSVMKISPIGLH